MAVALGDLRIAVNPRDAAAFGKRRLEGAKPHGAAEIAALAALFQFVAAHPFGHHADDRLLRRRRTRSSSRLDAAQIARRFHARHLHAEANAEVRHAAFAREFGGQNFAFRAALAEAARHQNAVHAFQMRRRVFALEHFAFDPVELDLDAVGDAAMHQRFDQRFVGVLQSGVFADDGNRHLAFGRRDVARDRFPARQIGLRRASDAERGQHFAVEAFAVIGERHVIDRRHVERLNDRFFAHVAEQRDFLALACRHLAIRTAQQNIGLNADRAQLFDRMLRRLGLQFAGRRNVRHQRQMHVDRRAARQIVAELADGFEKRQAFDVADRAADFDQHEIDVLVAVDDELLDGVGDVRNDLHGAAEVIAAPLLGEDLLVDAPRGDVVRLLGRHAGEALVVAEIEIGFRAVVGDEHLAVLIRAHGARIDVQIGIELFQADGIAARLQKRAEGGGCEAFSKGGDHAAGDEDIALHGSWVSHDRPRISKRQIGHIHGGLGKHVQVVGGTRGFLPQSKKRRVKLPRRFHSERTLNLLNLD